MNSADKTPEGLKRTFEGPKKKEEDNKYLMFLVDPRAIGTGLGFTLGGAYKYFKGRKSGTDADDIKKSGTDADDINKPKTQKLLTGEVRDPSLDPRTRAEKLAEGIRLNEEKLAKLKANGGSASEIEALENEIKSQKRVQQKGQQKLLTAGDENVVPVAKVDQIQKRRMAKDQTRKNSGH